MMARSTVPGGPDAAGDAEDGCMGGDCKTAGGRFKLLRCCLIFNSLTWKTALFCPRGPCGSSVPKLRTRARNVPRGTFGARPDRRGEQGEVRFEAWQWHVA